MASKNDDSSGLAIAAAFVCAIAIAMFLIVAAVLSFLAFVFTVLSLLAWNERLTIGRFTIEPEEARAFIQRGLIGMVLLPLFALFCQVLFQIPINGQAWPYIILGGYVLGSVGIEILMAEQAQNAPPTITLPSRPAEPPHSTVLPPPSAPAPFRYASWDDEEERR